MAGPDCEFIQGSVTDPALVTQAARAMKTSVREALAYKWAGCKGQGGTSGRHGCGRAARPRTDRPGATSWPGGGGLEIR